MGTGNSSIDQIAFYQKGFRMIGVEIGFFERNYNDKIYENGILCRDKIWFLKKCEQVIYGCYIKIIKIKNKR